MLNKVLDIKDILKSIPENSSNIIEYFLDNLDELDMGKNEIKESDISIIRLKYKTKKLPLNQTLLYEKHKYNIDIHVVLKGCELISVKKSDNRISIEEYNPDGDYELCESDLGSIITLGAGEGIILDTHTWHSTGYSSNQSDIEKLVIKVPRDILTD